MTLLLYDAIWFILLIAGVPIALVCLVFRPDWRRGFLQRFGFLPVHFGELKGRKTVWLHASSAGEVFSLVSVAEKLREALPERAFAISTMTLAGQKMASERLPWIKYRFYFPVDFTPVVSAVAKKISPEILVLTETEIWPGVLREVSRRGGKTVLVNARLSDGSYPAYRIFRGAVSRIINDCVFAVNAQTEKDAVRFAGLGVGADRVRVTGNSKHDTILLGSRPAGEKAKRLFPEIAGKTVFTAGSTHPGEEAPALDAFSAILKTFPGAVLVLAPRKPARAAEAASLASSRGFKTALRSETAGGPAPQVVVVDTMGELVLFYALSSAAFVGGSLVPAGGHNLMEPAAFGIPVFFGPHAFNQPADAALLKEKGIGFETADGESLGRAVAAMLSDPPRMDKIRAASRGLFAGNAAALNAQTVLSALPAKEKP